MAKKIEVHLCDEAIVIEGTLTETNDPWRWQVQHRPCPETLQWRCPCGAEIDTATIPSGRFYVVTGGYLLRCPRCGRWYMHHLTLGYVEAGPKESNVAHELRKRMPDEHGFLSAILAAPDDVALHLIYADFLEERGDARAEALRLKCAMATIPEGEPRCAELVARLEQLRPTLDPEWFALVVRLGPAAVCLIGSPEYDLAELPQRLPASGVNVRPPGIVQDGDYVVFCISCLDGPTAGTQEAMRRCGGRTLAPVAIVLTRADMVDNDSLRDLVTAQWMEWLSQVIPSEQVERLPLYYDFDPSLARKLLARIYAGPAMIPCGGA